MTKSESKLVVMLVIGGAVFYALRSIFSAIGTGGVILISVLSISIVVTLRIIKSRSDKSSFDDLAIYVLKNKLEVTEAQRLNQRLIKSSHLRAALIRDLQILCDSIHLALHSKKRETAEYRMGLALEKHRDAIRKMPSLVSPFVILETNLVVADAEVVFHTSLYLNAADGHCTKAQTLKTQKAKLKNFELARSVLMEGLHMGRGDLLKLREALENVEQLMSKNSISCGGASPG